MGALDSIFKFVGMGEYNAVPPVAKSGKTVVLQVDAVGRLKTVDESIGIHTEWTPVASAAASGVILNGPNRIATISLTNAGGSQRWIWLYDGAKEVLAAVSVKAGETEQVIMGAGIGYLTTTNLNFKASSSAETFTADGSAKIRAQANYYIDPATLTTPTIVSVSPGSYALAGGDGVINGTNFVTGAVVQVQVSGATYATVASTVISPTQISFTAPAHAAGSASIRVTNPDGSTALRENAITYSAAGAPTISSGAPNPISTLGGTYTITGTGFVAGASVKIDNASVTVIAVDSATQIRVTAPAKTAGSYSVEVINPDASTSGAISNAITYAAVFDPTAVFTLSRYFRAGGYNAGTGVWTGVGSLGTSGSNNATNSFGSAPTDGATVNTYKSVHFNGSNLAVSSDDSHLGKTGFILAFVVKTASVSVDDTTAWYAREVLTAIASGGGEYVTISSDGTISFGAYDGAFAHEDVSGYATGAWQVYFCKFETVTGTTTLKIKKGKGAWSTGTTIGTPLATVAGAHYLGYSGSSAGLSNTDMLEHFAAAGAANIPNDANLDNYVDYINARYGLAIS